VIWVKYFEVRDKDCAVYPSSVHARQQIYECNSGGQLSMARENRLGRDWNQVSCWSTIFVHVALPY
jgi:hypothetical protein